MIRKLDLPTHMLDLLLKQESRKAFSAYMKTRKNDCSALWVTDEGGMLTLYRLR
jgi:hypothetical protein